MRCRFFYFSAIRSSFRHVRIRVYIYNIVQTARAVARILLNSLDFWSSKTVTSMLLLSVVLLKPIHAMTFGTKFLLFVSIRVPPNNPITACGATSFPGYHSFPKWAMQRKNSLVCGFDADFLPNVFRVFEKLWAVFNAEKIFNPSQVALIKIPRDEAEIYQKTDFLSFEGHLLTSPGCCLALASSLHVVQVRFASWSVYRVL